MRSDFENEAQRAYTLLARLEMVSHGTVMRIASDKAGGGGERIFPPGGIGRRDDLEAVGEASELKTHVHFRPRVEACRTKAQYAAVAGEIQDALWAWTRATRPQRDTEAWREQVGSEMAARLRRRGSGSAERIAAKWRISKKSAYQYEQEYLRKIGAAA